MRRIEQQGKSTVRSGYGEIEEMFISKTRSNLLFFYPNQKLGHMNIRDYHVKILRPYVYRLSYNNSWQSLSLIYKPFYDMYPSCRP
jgi:hypothetical protein